MRSKATSRVPPQLVFGMPAQSFKRSLRRLLMALFEARSLAVQSLSLDKTPTGSRSRDNPVARSTPLLGGALDTLTRATAQGTIGPTRPPRQRG
jgi:hypothetical protein